MNNPNYLLQQQYASSSSSSCVSTLLHPNPTLHEYHASAPLIYDHQQASPYANGGAYANDYLDSFPPGYRFMPYDHELVQYYLKKKLNNEDLPPNNIHVVNIYASNPDELAELYKPGGENEWYFFATRDRKYMNGKRPSRSAKDGYWKASGADKNIMYEGVVIGFKKVLVFYQGKPPKGVKTDWLMHEFTLRNPPIIKRKQNDMRLDDCVLCKIYKKRERMIVFQKFLREGEAQIEEGSSDDQTLHDNDDGILYDYLENGYPNEMLYDDCSINEYPNGISQPKLVPVIPSAINLTSPSGSRHDYLDSPSQFDLTEWICGI